LEDSAALNAEIQNTEERIAEEEENKGQLLALLKDYNVALSNLLGSSLK
jgi:hypothetical protein